jgi:hypothetical protein
MTSAPRRTCSRAVVGVVAQAETWTAGSAAPAHQQVGHGSVGVGRSPQRLWGSLFKTRLCCAVARLTGCIAALSCVALQLQTGVLQCCAALIPLGRHPCSRSTDCEDASAAGSAPRTGSLQQVCNIDMLQNTGADQRCTSAHTSTCALHRLCHRSHRFVDQRPPGRGLVPRLLQGAQLVHLVLGKCTMQAWTMR